MKILIYALSILFLAGVGALYGGIGWVIAWVLDKGLDVNVNYSIFVWVGVGIFIVKVIPLMIVRAIAAREQKKFDDHFKEFDKKFNRMRDL
jgi:hypothetical protein